MEISVLPVPVLMIEQDSEVISVLIAMLAEIKQVSLHIFPSCEPASKALKKVNRPEIILFTDTGEVRETKRFTRLLRRYPDAFSVVTFTGANEENEALYRKAGVKEFLYKNDFYIGALRQSIRKTLLRRLLPVARAEITEQEFTDFVDKICRLNRGDLLSHYRISSEIVSSLSGKIYRAKDLDNGHVVSLQIIAPTADGEESAGKLLSQAKSLMTFQHAGIARVLDVVDTENLPFVVSEFIEGETLLSLIERGPVGFLRLTDIGSQIADALDAAHRSGLIHGGIRPSNIILTKDEGARLLDCIRTRRHVSASVSTLPMEVARYLSPEQTRGDEGDPRSDIFSLGSVLYYAATGMCAFDAPNTVSMLLEIVTEDAQPPSAIKQDLPEEFDAIIGRCLAKDKAQRYQTAADLAYALRRLKLSTIYNLPAETDEDDDSFTLPLPAPVRTTTPLLTKRAKLILTILCFALASLTAAFFYRIAPQKQIVPTLAILPFQNSVGPLNTEYIADGLTFGLIDSISPVTSWRILPATTVFRFKGPILDLPRLIRESSATRYLQGNVDQDQQTIRVSATLVNATDGATLWQKHYDISVPSEVLEVQNEIAKEVVHELKVDESEENLKRMFSHQPKIPAAYPLFLRARYLANRDQEKDLLNSIELYHKAVTIDPDYAAAYAGMADAWLMLVRTYLGYSADTYARAQEAADKAASLDPSLAEAYRVRGAVNLFYAWNFAKAEKNLRRALVLNETDALTHGYLAVLMTARGEFHESLAEMHTALALEPNSTFLNEQYAYLLLQQRRFDDAIAQAKREAERQGSPFLYRLLGDSYMAKRMYEEAQDVYKLSEDLGSSNAQVRVAAAMAGGGLKSEARSLLVQIEKNQNTEHLDPDFMAAAYTLAGEHRKALDWLSKAYESHSDSMIMLKINFFWDPLRNERRFQQIVDHVFSTER